LTNSTNKSTRNKTINTNEQENSNLSIPNLLQSGHHVSSLKYDSLKLGFLKKTKKIN
jgi:hypothetical protein